MNATDGQPFVADWVLALWPRLRPYVLVSLDHQTDEDRDQMLEALAAGPGSLVIREIDGYVHVAAGRPLLLLCSVPLEAVMPESDSTIH